MIYHDQVYIKKTDTIDIYVIGYKQQGESIIVNVANSFIGVIDCYKTVNHFITKDILKNIGKKLDFICWTHTDEDHTKGLSELFAFIKNDTSFILPEGISYKEATSFLSSLFSGTAGKEYKTIFDLIKSKIHKSNVVSASLHTPSIYNFPLVELTTGVSYNLTLDAFAPNSGIARENTLKNIRAIVKRNKNSHANPNYFSVGLKLSITTDASPPILICLAGDVDNYTLREYDHRHIKQFFANNTVLKIPHHCSTNSDMIINNSYIKHYDYAITTGYKVGRSNLPDVTLLQKYKTIPNGNLSRTELNNHDYGLVKYSIPISSFLPQSISVDHHGAAGVV